MNGSTGDDNQQKTDGITPGIHRRDTCGQLRSAGDRDAQCPDHHQTGKQQETFRPEKRNESNQPAK
ncbi:MAG: hypothetical protein ACK526_08435 [Planctomyces sp.]